MEQRLGEQGMACRQHADLVQAQQALEGHAFAALALLSEAQIEALGAQPVVQQRRLLGRDVDGAACAQARAGCGQEGVGQGRQAQHLERAGLVAGQGTGAAGHPLQTFEGTLHLIEQGQGPGRGLEPAALALEQGIAEQELQPGELPADGRLGAVQLPGGLTDAAGQHHGAEDLDMAVTDR